MIRPAGPADVPRILALIRELAVYEKAGHSVEAGEDELRSSLFGPAPAVFCHLAEHDGEVVGFALWFLSFSTWTGRHGIWLEDLFVRPAARGQGHGRLLIGALAALCAELGYSRLEWAVLDWNAPAIGFYQALGAVPLDDWTTHRLTGAALVAAAAPGAG